jgi:hypothetical protein
MEKFLKRIINTAVVGLSLLGVIACSEMEALDKKALGGVTFTGEPETECALDVSLLQADANQTLGYQTQKTVTLVRSTQTILTKYGVDLACFFDSFMGPAYETASAKFKINNFAFNDADFVLSVTLHDVEKTYHFDSKNAFKISLKRDEGAQGSFNPSNDSIGTQMFADYEFTHHTLNLTLIKVDPILNIWKVTIVVQDKSIDANLTQPTDQPRQNFYDLGSFEISLDNNSII